MDKSITITETFNISGEANPLLIKAKLTCEYKMGSSIYGWVWSVDEIICAEIVIGDKEGIEITRQVLDNARAKAMVEAQIESCDTQIIEALANHQSRII